MKNRLAFCVLASAAFGAIVLFAARTPLFSANYLPHRFCYLAQPGLIWTNVAMDALIAISYVAIFASLLWIAIRLRGVPTLRGYLWIFVSFGLFIVACAATHSMEIVTVWWPVYPLSAGFKVLCAAASVPTAILFARAAPALRRNALVQLQWLSAAEAQRDVARSALQLSFRSEAELEAANRYLDGFRLMIDAVQDYAVFMLDPEGFVTTWNAGAERIKGYQRTEIVGKHFTVFYTAAQVADGLPERELKAARETGRSEDEGSRVRQDGTLLWANVIITALRGPDGNLVGFGEVTRDLTERRRAEQALQEFNRQLSEAFECTSDSIMSIDENWSIIYGNSKAIRSLPDFQLGHDYWTCFPAVRGTKAEQQLLNTMNSRLESAYEIFYQPYQTWFRARIFPSGAAGITAFFSDITHEKKVEEELLSHQQQREERFDELSQLTSELHSVMDSTSNGILKLSSTWRILYGNRVSMESLPDFRMNADFWDCFSALHGTVAERELRLAMRDRVETHYEISYAPYDRSYKVHVYPDGDGVSLFFSDTTAEKKLEGQLSHERMLREKRIEALSHMAGGLAHEISNPLAIIHARASDLKDAAVDVPAVPADEVSHACASIVSTADHAIKILRGLRGFAREAGNDPMEWGSVADIVEQCIDLQQGRFERHHVDLSTDLAPALPLLLCRETQIGQIVTNLLNNAFDAIDQHQCTVRWVRLSAKLQSEAVQLDVVDSGPGIDEHSRAHLMEPFFTTKTRGLGMGVGLSLSRAIAVEHGGTLTLCDDPGPTCFRLILPLQHATAATANHRL